MKLSAEAATRMNRISYEAETVRVIRKRLIDQLQVNLQKGEEKGDYNMTDANTVFSLVGAEAVLETVIDEFYSSIRDEGHTSSQVHFLRAFAVQPTKEGARRRFIEGDSV